MSNQLRDKKLRLLPSVDEVLRHDEILELLEAAPRGVVVEAVRAALAEERIEILAGETPDNHETGESEYLELIAKKTIAAVQLSVRPKLRRVINATGVVLHTNLGRSRVFDTYSNIEIFTSLKNRAFFIRKMSNFFRFPLRNLA